MNSHIVSNAKKQMSDHNGTLTPNIGGYLSAQPPYAARNSGHQPRIGKA